MRKKLQAFVFLVFFLGLLRGICAEDAKQANSTPVIVISTLSGSKADVPGWQPSLGQGISEMLIETLEGSDKNFQVLETPEATGSQSEPKPGASNSAGGETKSARGGSAGSQMPAASDATSSEKPDTGGPTDSDFTFCGEVTQFTMETNNTKIVDFIPSSSFAGLGGKIYTAHVQIQWRLVDSETKKVVKRGITACSASGSDFDMANATGGNSPVATSAASLVKTPAVGNAVAPVKAPVVANTTAHAKTPVAGQSGANNLASFNNLFSGFNKALGNAPSGASGAGNTGGGKSSSGTAAQSAKAAPKAGGDVVAAPESETIGYGNPAFMDSALGKATAKAVTDIIRQLDAASLPEPGRITKVKTATDALRHSPGKVLAVAGKDAIIVSLGSKQGFKEGDMLELYQLNDVKDDKGNVVFTDEKLVGEITLQAVQDEKSRASYSGDAQVQQGWTVKSK